MFGAVQDGWRSLLSGGPHRWSSPSRPPYLRRAATTDSRLVHRRRARRVDGRPGGQTGCMAWTYIVECADGSLYVGSTIDLDRRISQHNLGLGSAYTRLKRRPPVRLAWAVFYDRVDDAYDFEKQIQGWGRAKRIALIEGRLDDLPALARSRSRRRKDDG